MLIVLSGALIRLEVQNQQLDKKTKQQFELYRKEVEQQQLNSIKDFNAEQQRQREDLEKQIQQLKHDLEARKAARSTIASKLIPSAQAAQNSAPSGSHADWMRLAGIPGGDWQYVEYIIAKESGWNPNAINRASGAEGLPQALPYSKTGCAHGDPVCQLKWADSYAKARYGGWDNAKAFWTKNQWW